MTRLDRRYDPDVERATLRHVLVGYAGIPADQHLPALDSWFGIRGAGVDEAALGRKIDEMYAATELGDLEQRMRWLEATPEEFEKSDDPFIALAVATYPERMQIERQEKDLSGRLNQVRPSYMQGLIAFRASHGQPIYPDANGTLRVTYGTVQGYSPRDGVFYTPFTTVDGIVEKDTGEDPFDAPPALLEAVKARRFGRYAVESLGSVPVNFLSNVDTTGGNSGSPTLNGRGELVGLLFDGVWESIIADWDFLPDRTRSIHVDIRYALWVMSEVDHADRLLREMGVAKSGGEPGR
jgi:hypothetical protein